MSYRSSGMARVLAALAFAIAVASNAGVAELGTEIFHVADVFQEDYEQMEQQLKVFVYPDPVVYTKLAGKYASEGYFFRNLMESRFVTTDPEKAQLFFVPISCARLREEGLDHDEISDNVASFVESVIAKFPYWNRTMGADHFFVTCHEIGTRATSKVAHLVKNSIRVVCASSYSGPFIPHKDVALPQILQPFPSPRGGDDTEKRETLGFWAGPANSKTRILLTKTWQEDSDMVISTKHVGMQQFYRSKFCICPSGTRVSTARIVESIHFGCVPVILSDHYDLPFNDVLDWRKFAVILPEQDAGTLKDALELAPYATLHRNLLQAQAHFEWHSPPIKYDTFHMVMYELWLRHSTVRY
ncbi:probable glycosyltransferase At5g03795 [Selaginella moellendorffii]|uniref:probable glycosyltransferase At5g03795 n=1 Tax=Selaginella moellendorffii TaxID=88036 RepID=UPI000D1C3177|nr:probable glycosyltransferase At5g03795 [Selaginella moellendorffii]|eukprot:XP_024522746.1 probable glycosyltransferase At5g03795 [Selaginella moellendorffii]